MIKPLTEQGQALDTPPDYQPPAASIQDASKASQQRRLLAGLIEAGANGVTTIQARRDLNVMQPAARIQELREQGYKIATIRQPVKLWPRTTVWRVEDIRSLIENAGA